jgi:hypothetical protein
MGHGLDHQLAGLPLGRAGSGARAADDRGHGDPLDGDGRSDLAIGAPRDRTVGAEAGSATLVFGASL